MIARHQGRIVKVTGDGVLVEFASAVNAVACAADLQRDGGEPTRTLPEDQRIVLRIGVNLGDMMVEGDDLYGDGVNIAARLEALAEPGGVRSPTACTNMSAAGSTSTSTIAASRRSRTSSAPVRVCTVAGTAVARPCRRRAGAAHAAACRTGRRSPCCPSTT